MFTDKQRSIICGSLLGDAHLTAIRTKNSNSAFIKPQCDKRKEYLLWHFDRLPYSCSIKPKNAKLNGKEHLQYVFRTHCSPEFRELRLKWYPLGKKIVPIDTILDPLMVAIWFADDGQNFAPDGQAIFHTQGFEEEDRKLLVKQLAILGIYSYTNETKRIYVRGNCYSKFLDLISPYFVWECLKYKVDKTGYNPKYNHLCEEIVVEVFKYYYGDKLKQAEIAGIFGIDESSVSDILRGNSYGHLGLSQATQGVKLNGFPGKGVSFDKIRNKWKACLGRKFLGRFDTEEEALKVREKEKVIIMRK